MKLSEDTIIKYKEVLFDYLSRGDVFEDKNGDILIKIENVIHAGLNFNAIELSSGLLAHCGADSLVYPVEADLRYKKITED